MKILLETTKNEHSTMFYIVFGGFWLLVMLITTIAAAICGECETYNAVRDMWKQCKKDCGIM